MRASTSFTGSIGANDPSAADASSSANSSSSGHARQAAAKLTDESVDQAILPPYSSRPAIPDKYRLRRRANCREDALGPVAC